jgi:hypothetical protein
MTQRAIALAGYETFDAALRDPTFEFPMDEIAVAISCHSKIFQGNLVAGLVWESVDGVRSDDDLARTIVQRFHIDEATALRDVSALLELLKSYDLIEQVAESSAEFAEAVL